MNAAAPPKYRSHAVIVFAAGVLRLIAVLLALSATIIALVAITGAMGRLGPFLGIAGVPLFVGSLFGLAQAILFWAVADALVLLADADDAHVKVEASLKALLSRGLTAAPAPDTSGAGWPTPPPTADLVPPSSFPGYRATWRRVMRRLRVAANLTDAPGYQADAVCPIEAGEVVAVLGEVRQFLFVESPGGSGWLPKTTLEE